MQTFGGEIKLQKNWVTKFLVLSSTWSTDAYTRAKKILSMRGDFGKQLKLASPDGLLPSLARYFQ